MMQTVLDKSFEPHPEGRLGSDFSRIIVHYPAHSDMTRFDRRRKEAEIIGFKRWRVGLEI